MKKSLVLLICSLTFNALFAQTDYATRAAALQKEIWGSPIAEFKATTVPANLAGEGAVILARSYSSQRSSSGRFKFMIISAAVALHSEKVSTLHERVKINDKVALENYSTLEYQKILDKTVSLLITRFKNTHNTFIGAKIIKPDGKEVIVNTGEEVLTKDESKDKQGKLAISGLQVGDILDYYVTNVEVTETGTSSTYNSNDNIFVFADEYPILYYSIDLQFNKKLNVRHIYANGAPHFEENRNNDGDLLLSLKARNIPKYQSQLWTSSLRQYPYIELASAYNDSRDKIIDKNGFDERTAMLEANKMLFEELFAEMNSNYESFEKGLKNAFGSNRNFKNAPLDSVVQLLYNQWKYKTFDFYYKEDFDDIPAINYRSAVSRSNVIDLCFILNDLKIDFDILLVSSRNNSTLDNAFNFDDFDAMIRVNSAQPLYLCFDDAVNHFNEIPVRFQGEKAIVLRAKKKNNFKYEFTEGGEEALPVAAADNNFISEDIKVSLIQPAGQKLRIERDVKKGGSLQHDDQKQLISTFDIDESIAEAGKAEGIGTRFRNYKDRDIYINGLQSSADKAKTDLDKNFTSEIKANFDQDPQQVSDCKIINMGLKEASPILEYSATFMIDNMVKKAGNNYIVSMGKLTGNFLTLEEKDKKRTVDVYMPAARSFKYNIVFNIPPGFNVKGAEEMNIKKSNKAGSFTSTATVNGNTLTISVARVYNHNFEKAADWPLLVDIINTASDFNTKKILLEKKG